MKTNVLYYSILLPQGEIINVFVGQCGSQLSMAFWELFCIEHGLDPEGSPVCLEGQSGDDFDEGRHVFFEESDGGTFSPRTVILDSEPIVVGTSPKIIF